MNQELGCQELGAPRFPRLRRRGYDSCLGQVATVRDQYDYGGLGVYLTLMNSMMATHFISIISCYER